MNAHETRKLDRLLSGSQLSVQEAEVVLAAVLARGRVEAPDRRSERCGARWLVALSAGLTAAAAAGVVVVVAAVVPRPRLSSGTAAHELEFVNRGGEVPASGGFSLRCLPGREGAGPRAGSACRQGDRLFFDLRPATGGQYFSAAALADDGLLIWYFPSDTQASIWVRGPGIAGMGALIAGEQSPGRYRVFGAFSASPLTRDELRAAIDGNPRNPALPIELSQMELEVLPP